MISFYNWQFRSNSPFSYKSNRIIHSAPMGDFRPHLKVLSHKFSALLPTTALLPSSADWIPFVAPAFSAQLFGPLAFSGFGHRGTPVLSANLGNSENRWERG